ncbi:MAG: hypothetical protein BGO01_06150 [Armatimonadetes bacterium 55-13]|nr:hypothetical protein [Armatimonadota bacterium]OJU61645.1 MAG: hypothetical protein BGO01_06150 [Armatimonadetes bacterium 55-13]
MSAFARFLARISWKGMLWLMRRPWMKSLQRASTNLFPPGQKRERAKLSMVRQNKFARKVGLPILTVAYNLLLASVILTTSYFVVLNLYESGALSATDSMKQSN